MVSGGKPSGNDAAPAVIPMSDVFGITFRDPLAAKGIEILVGASLVCMVGPERQTAPEGAAAMDVENQPWMTVTETPVGLGSRPGFVTMETSIGVSGKSNL